VGEKKRRELRIELVVAQVVSWEVSWEKKSAASTVVTSATGACKLSSRVKGVS
jgi:hypothetical protein